MDFSYHESITGIGYPYQSRSPILAKEEVSPVGIRGREGGRGAVYESSLPFMPSARNKDNNEETRWPCFCRLLAINRFLGSKIETVA